MDDETRERFDALDRRLDGLQAEMALGFAELRTGQQAMERNLGRLAEVVAALAVEFARHLGTGHGDAA